jgi:ketosteroid isomerase-like protein
MPEASEEILQLIKILNQAWLEGKFEKIPELLHPHVVFVHPNFAGQTAGRQACAKSYADFMSQAKVLRFRDSDAQIDVFGATAIATYRFEIRYEMAGKTFDETGRDVLVLNNARDQWQVVWRCLVSFPEVIKRA